jgi:hypothetical protein
VRKLAGNDEIRAYPEALTIVTKPLGGVSSFGGEGIFAGRIVVCPLCVPDQDYLKHDCASRNLWSEMW